jgi:hypothetical protein
MATIKRTRRRNNKPEDLVVKPQIKILCHQFGILVWEIQASTYDPFKKVYSLRNHAPKGHPDLAGICPDGTAFFCELKAPKRRYNVSPLQKAFLLSVIEHGAFGCVTDSMEHFRKIWTAWTVNRSKAILIDDIP